MTELKKCPFCGGKAFKKATTHDSRNYQDNFIECHSCGVEVLCSTTEIQLYAYPHNGPICEFHNTATAENWNARPEQDRLEALNAELVDALKSANTSMCEFIGSFYQRQDVFESLEKIREAANKAEKALEKATAKGAEDEH